jgi:hypothetical protein
MKPCPDCGEPMRLMARQWVHARSARCRTITLRATEEDVQQFSAGKARNGTPMPGGKGEWRFRYLTTDGAS